MDAKSSTFVCYGDLKFSKARDQLAKDAESLGLFDQIEVWDYERLSKTAEFQSLDSRIRQHNGHMYFWWKPFIIRKALEETQEGGYVFYCDSGRYDGGFRLTSETKFLIDEFRATGFTGVLVPQFGSNERWTKNECFQLMECTSKEYYESSQIQATFSMWVKGSISSYALAEWERCCRDYRLVSDEKAEKQKRKFKAHRHDQSLLTILSLKYGLRHIRIGNDLSYLVLKRLKCIKEINTEFKKIPFVAQALRSRKVLRPLMTAYLIRKLSIGRKDFN